MKKKTISISLVLGLLVLMITLASIHTGTAVNVKGAALRGEVVPQKCSCTCEFAKREIITAGDTDAPGGGQRYSFEPNVKTSCTGTHCTIASITYAWTVTGTATFTIGGGIANAKKIDVDVTKAGDVTLSCAVTVTCSDGSTCSATGTGTFKNLKP